MHDPAILRPRAGLLCLALAGVTLYAAPAAAQKTDVITLRNGDHITGEIKNIEQGRLQLSTNAMDTVYIRWIDIASIQSDKTLEVQLRSGEPIYGSLQPAPTSGDIVVDSEGGSTTLPNNDVASAHPIGQSFWKKLDGNLSLGLNFTQASGQAESDLSFSNTLTSRHDQISVDISSTIKRIQGETTTNRQELASAWRRRIRWPQWFSVVLGGLQKNSELNLAFRGSIGAGAGRYLRNTSTYNWSVYSTGLFTQERYTGDPGRQEFDVLAGTSLDVFLYGTHDFILSTDFQAIPSVTDAGRVRLNFNHTLSYELVNNFTIGLQFYEQYDSRPPQEGAEKNDFGINTTFGYHW